MELATAVRRLQPVLADLADLVLPVDCAGCAAPGRVLCADCRFLLGPEVSQRELPGLRVWSGLAHEGVVQRAVVAFKNEGRTDLARPLAAALRAAVEEALAVAPGGRLDLVPMPRTLRSARQRGYDPTRVLLARAGLPCRPLLVLRRAGRRQASLGRDARFTNADASMRARSAGGRPVLLVDDVVTTGATLLEAARAVRGTGGEVVGAVTLASTPRRLAAR